MTECKDEANGELLFQLVNTEKGKCKTVAQKALAQLEYAPAAPLGNGFQANGACPPPDTRQLLRSVWS